MGHHVFAGYRAGPLGHTIGPQSTSPPEVPVKYAVAILGTLVVSLAAYLLFVQHPVGNLGCGPRGVTATGLISGYPDRQDLSRVEMT